MARFSIGHSLGGGFSGRVYFGRWPGYRNYQRPVVTRGRRRMTINQNLHGDVTLTRINIDLDQRGMEKLREYYELDRRRNSHMWTNFFLALAMIWLIGAIVMFWFISVPIFLGMGGLFAYEIRKRIATERSGKCYSPPFWAWWLRAGVDRYRAWEARRRQEIQ